MQTIVMILVAFVREIALSRATSRLENVALRQQVAVLKRERPRPRLHPLDRVFWVFLSRLVVHRVARFGRFKERRLNLRPGTYTAVGSRPGYRDVRVRFSVRPSSEAIVVEVRCEERI